MKLNKLIYSLPLAIGLVVIGTGCGKDKFNINQNINSPTDSTVTYDVVLPAALHATGTIVANQWGTTQNWMGFWARSGTYAPSVIEESYQITTGFGTGIWNNCYDNNYDYQIIISKAAQASAGFYEGIARIMKAHNYQMLVDVYGNVPYSQALKGGLNPTPAYDNGVDIYKNLFRELDAAIALIKGAVVNATNPNKNIATNDIVFGGDKGKWIRFANTLKLRLLVHAYAVSGFPIAAEMAIINTEGSGFLGAGENVMVQPGYVTDKPNPFYNNYRATPTGTAPQNSVYYKANEWGIEYYKYNADGRTTRFYEAGANGLVGVAYGLPPITANAAANLAGIGPGLYKTNTAPQAIMIAAESYFLQAEARLRGFLTSGPSVVDLTNQGIQESFTYMGVSGSAASYISGNAGYSDVDAAAVANTPANPAGTQPVGGLFTIISQKWFALNGITPLEVWTDYRRVGYNQVVTSSPINDRFVYGAGVGFDAGPPLSVAPQNTSTKIPVRYLYPQTEYNYNAANVGAQGTVERYSRIFWDIN
ncbi:MAG: SusD/RagB family nutrient-binding outer membrane lipoprotein [Chitinophagaceae bacterium]|nr:SusD/RagB family nutrient-binding outer membrane lipoprotein [Chitinophagaceae bacterium]